MTTQVFISHSHKDEAAYSSLCLAIDRSGVSRCDVSKLCLGKPLAEGLRADAAYIFEAAESLQHVMANNRLTRLHIPILGSGHGGMKGEVSLVCMLVAFGELHRKQSGHNLKDINIVVFRRGENCAPSISEVSIQRALDFASRFLPH